MAKLKGGYGYPKNKRLNYVAVAGVGWQPDDWPPINKDSQAADNH